MCSIRLLAVAIFDDDMKYPRGDTKFVQRGNVDGGKGSGTACNFIFLFVSLDSLDVAANIAMDLSLHRQVILTEKFGFIVLDVTLDVFVILYLGALCFTKLLLRPQAMGGWLAWICHSNSP